VGQDAIEREAQQIELGRYADATEFLVKLRPRLRRGPYAHRTMSGAEGLQFRRGAGPNNKQRGLDTQRLTVRHGGPEKPALSRHTETDTKRYTAHLPMVETTS